MKITLASSLVLLLAIASPAAAEWVLVGASGSVTAFVDDETVQPGQNGRIRYVALKRNNQTLNDFQSLEETDCANRVYTLRLQVSRNGRLIGNRVYNPPQINRVYPGSIQAGIQNSICQ